MVTVIDTGFEGLLLFEPKVFEDPRGYFFESFNDDVYAKAGLKAKFVQDNQSLSQKAVLRGLHFQNPPYEQGKLVRVIKGAVLDITLDIRKKSPTYGKHFSVELNETNKKCLYVPPGFAHGFSTLENNTIFFYKCTNYYNKNSEGAVLWNDSDLNINWNIANPTLSEKDSNSKPFKDLVSLF